MKKLFVLFLLTGIHAGTYAGGLVTNTNQSAAWVRCPSMNAYTGISAVYYNPAGLMRLQNGFHISLNNQVISQTRLVDNFYSGIDSLSGLNNSHYEGSVLAPLFPGVYAVYKRDKFALSFGFNAVGGGGSAKYKRGLPSLELSVSDLVYSLSSAGVTEYRLNSSFEGSSVFFGYQGGISFNVSETVSLFGGVRFVTAKNTYKGYIRDIELYNFGGSGSWMRADMILAGIAGDATTGATTLQAAIDGGLVAAGDPASPDVIDQLGQLGIVATGYTNAMAVAGFTAAAKEFNNNSVLLNDQELDVTEKGHGFTPIFGINIAPNDKLNIAIKIEFPTMIELTRDTKKDAQIGWLSPNDTIPDTMYPDGRKYHSDMPAMVAAGISYKMFNKLTLHLSGNLYFDRDENLSYGKTYFREYIRNYIVIDHNSYELAGGLEYQVTPKLLLSGGYLMSKNGVNSMYQSDVSYALNSNTICIGGAFNISEKMQLNLGAGYSLYSDDYKYLRHEVNPALVLYPKETYDKKNLFFGIGLDLSF